MKKIILVFAFLIVHCTLSIEHCVSQVWSPMGSGMTGGIANVAAFTIYNNQLISGGGFTIAGGVSANHIAKWNGVSWLPFGSGTNNKIRAITVFNNELIVCGDFSSAGGVNANHIAKWNGTSWVPLGSGMNNFLSTLTVYNNELIAGGRFDTAGGVRANCIAKWNGTNWVPLGSGMGGSAVNEVLTLTVYNNELIAGGHFTTVGGINTSGIAKWNGTSWTSFGSGLNLGEETAKAFTIYNGELVVGGGFGMVGGVPVENIAKWNGTTWSPIGTGVGYSPYALTVYNNELIVGGSILNAGGVSVNRIAKWNGTNWSPLGSGISGTYGILPSPLVLGLTVYNNELIVGGCFTMAGGDSAICIARWWTPFSISGLVRYSDNNQPATGGFVKAFKLDRNTGNIITFDSVQIQSDGSYTLTNVPQDSVDIGIYPNSTTTNDWVITYYPSTTYWENATTLYPTGNLTNINIGAIRMSPATNNNSVNGKVMRITDNPLGNLKDAVLYAKNGNTFVRCAVSDGNGVYHLNSLPAGNLKIIVNRLGFTSDSTMVNVTATSNTDSINFYLYKVPVGIKQIGNTVPSEYKLYQNYPNPFNSMTNVKWQMLNAGNVKIVLYDILGKEVATLVNEKQSPGIYEIMFDASYLPSGIYFYKLETQSYKETKRMVLIK